MTKRDKRSANAKAKVELWKKMVTFVQDICKSEGERCIAPEDGASGHELRDYHDFTFFAGKKAEEVSVIKVWYQKGHRFVIRGRQVPVFELTWEGKMVDHPRGVIYIPSREWQEEILKLIYAWENAAVTATCLTAAVAQSDWVASKKV